jgi:hypothetical protein
MLVKWMLLAVTVVLAACSHDVRARYPSQANEPTGTLILTMANAASGVSVAVNGVLVVDDAHTGHIQVDGVPVGTQEIIMAANGSDKAFRVWVGSERPTTVPLGVPEAGSGFLKTLAGSLLTIVVYSLLH